MDYISSNLSALCITFFGLASFSFAAYVCGSHLLLGRRLCWVACRIGLGLRLPGNLIRLDFGRVSKYLTRLARGFAAGSMFALVNDSVIAHDLAMAVATVVATSY